MTMVQNNQREKETCRKNIGSYADFYSTGVIRPEFLCRTEQPPPRSASGESRYQATRSHLTVSIRAINSSSYPASRIENASNPPAPRPPVHHHSDWTSCQLSSRTTITTSFTSFLLGYHTTPSSAYPPGITSSLAWKRVITRARAPFGLDGSVIDEPHGPRKSAYGGTIERHGTLGRGNAMVSERSKDDPTPYTKRFRHRQLKRYVACRRAHLRFYRLLGRDVSLWRGAHCAGRGRKMKTKDGT
ncbi:hypothetical protein BJ875DRAFT_260298 [Amylocarpus encephaloides]|uniref:Uncharacterized protein n=1 Tax=Amylocarpus encephaloides TaxID=45428 RepID=A0A9P8BZK8_9HELO|nr:hypothetical protein BJ875DRAFT_260298 [Amylocarpus encephaloides]